MEVWTEGIGPNEILKRGLKWEKRLCGDSIVSSLWDLADDSPATDITILTGVPPFVGTNTFITLQGASLHSTYYITNSITTLGAQRLTETVQITCVPK